MSHISLLTLWNGLVPKVTATHIFEPEVLPRPLNEFLQILRIGVHDYFTSVLQNFSMRSRPFSMLAMLVA